MGMLACALVAFPAGLAADVGPGWQTAAHRGPLGDLRPAPDSSARYVSVPTALGATGSEPHDTTLSPQILHDADNPDALSTGAGPQANLPSGPLGIPGIVLDAYTHAADVLRVEQPNCHLQWWLLAGIGKIESGQAENGMVDANGTTLRPILGPRLDGSNGFAAIPAVDGGKWTGDPVWQRAVGPMQFLPSTWPAYGGNGNPNNVYDAAIAAGRYLCHSGLDLSVPANQATAVFNYNHSDSYVRIVLIWANAYAKGVTPLPETPLPPGTQAQGPLPVGVTAVPGTPGQTPIVTQLPGGGTPPPVGSTPPAAGQPGQPPSSEPPSSLPPSNPPSSNPPSSNPPSSEPPSSLPPSSNPPSSQPPSSEPPSSQPPSCVSPTPNPPSDSVDPATVPPSDSPSGTPTPQPCGTPTPDPAGPANGAAANNVVPAGDPTPTV